MTASLTRPMICLWGKYLTCCCFADLHAVHGLPQLVQLVCRAESLQADVGELHLLLPEFTA